MSQEFEIHITLKRVPLSQSTTLVLVLGQDWRIGDLVLMDDSFDADGRGEVKTLLNTKESNYVRAQAMMGRAANLLLDAGFTIVRLKIEQIIADSKNGDFSELLSA